MTVAAGYFNNASQSGSNTNWTDLGNLDTGGEAYATGLAVYPRSDVNDIYLSAPGALDSANGSQFEEMTVSWRDLADGFTGTVDVRWEGTIDGVSKTGTTFSNPVATGSYSSRSLTGDAAYWGFGSVTPSALLIAIRDGWLKFKYNVRPTGFWVADTAYLKQVQISITYTEVDTKRAAILTCVP